MATRSKARKSASRKTRNGDSYKGIPADKRKQVALTVRLLRATGKQTTPGKVYLGIAQDEAAQATQKEERAKEARQRALDDLPKALDMLADAAEITRASEADDTGLDAQILARCARLMIHEAGGKFEQALCNLGMIPEDDWSRFAGDLKSQVPKAAQPAQGGAQ